MHIIINNATPQKKKHTPLSPIKNLPNPNLLSKFYSNQTVNKFSLDYYVLQIFI